MTQLLVEIYGKTGCPYCEKAKQICETRELKYNYYTLDREYSRETLLEMFPGARTDHRQTDSARPPCRKTPCLRRVRA